MIRGREKGKVKIRSTKLKGNRDEDRKLTFSEMRRGKKRGKRGGVE